MKTTLFTSAIIVFFTSTVFSQFPTFCTDADDVKAIVKNVTCNPDNSTSFDLTVTKNGAFVTPSGFYNLVGIYDKANPPNHPFSSTGSLLTDNTGQVLNNKSFTTEASTGCFDSNEMFIYVEGLGCEALLETEPISPSVPTIGEWGLIVLALLMIIIGILALSSRKTKII